MQTKDGYIIFGEAYYPVYRKETVKHPMAVEIKKVFDGNQYTHTYVVKLDKKGDLKWSKIFEMDTKSIHENSKLTLYDNNTVELKFNYQDKEMVKIIDENGIIIK